MRNLEFEKAKKVLDNSGVIAFPTETVMGLGVYFDDKRAYDYLNEIKRRPEDKPYTLMLSNINDIEKYAYVSENASIVIKAFMPGSITILLKVKETVPGYVHHNTGIIGIRVPDVKETLELLSYLEKPLLVPSANRSGEKPALDSKEVNEIFKDEVGYVLEGKSTGGVPSTIVDLTGEQVKILREGPIKESEILSVLKGDK